MSSAPRIRAAAGAAPSPERGQHQQPGNARSTVFHAMLIVLAVALFAGFFALGTWQVARRTWKLDLIERVNQRVSAPAKAAPAPDQWPLLDTRADEYLHVRLSGKFLYGDETLVQAVTKIGSGFWVMTPLQQADGTLVLVNRGFVSNDKRDDAVDRPPAKTDVSVTGLLRKTEPVGGFLRKNDAIGNRWYSRDVQEIAAAHGLKNVAPFFVDADETVMPSGAPTAYKVLNEGPQVEPVGGLTVIDFHNNHLVYALTWYALALMVVGAAWHVVRDRRRHAGHD